MVLIHDLSRILSTLLAKDDDFNPALSLSAAAADVSRSIVADNMPSITSNRAIAILNIDCPHTPIVALALGSKSLVETDVLEEEEEEEEEEELNALLTE